MVREIASLLLSRALENENVAHSISISEGRLRIPINADNAELVTRKNIKWLLDGMGLAPNRTGPEFFIHLARERAEQGQHSLLFPEFRAFVVSALDRLKIDAAEVDISHRQAGGKGFIVVKDVLREKK